MKAIQKSLTVLLATIFTLGNLNAQYSLVESSSPGIIITDDLIEVLHEGAPDELTNKLETEIFVHVYDSNKRKYMGLQSQNGAKLDSVLKKGENSKIHKNQFRRGLGNRVELVITIPGKQNESGEWSYRDIKWFLGEKHEPSYSVTKHFDKRKGFQIRFIYENGLPRASEIEEKLEQYKEGNLPQDEAKKWEEHLRIHVNGHICRPEDELCGS